jgi:hypothetical protein
MEGIEWAAMVCCPFICAAQGVMCGSGRLGPLEDQAGLIGHDSPEDGLLLCRVKVRPEIKFASARDVRETTHSRCATDKADH